jgi:hypothetical protein
MHAFNNFKRTGQASETRAGRIQKGKRHNRADLHIEIQNSEVNNV